ncbi:MAG TPA: hypothetical protein VFK66_15200 [Oryzihumus sp.]|nr:hypothetical protein [Oryzihumus sp.]
MPLLSRRRADLFHRALEGAPAADHELAALVGTASRIPTLDGPACAPRPEFVEQLGARLRAEAQTLPARPVRQAAVREAPGDGPLVLVVGRGLPRALAGAVATVLVASAAVGVVSRASLPGTALYPVKQLLDAAAVQLAGSEHDRGLTLLAQAQQHISEAGDLADGGATDAAPYDVALGAAYDATLGGQRTLLALYDRDHDQQALIAVQDFTARALPQVQALRSRVPAASVPAVDRLLTVLQLGDEAVARKVEACGPACSALDTTGTGHDPASLPSLPSSTAVPTTGGPGLTGGTASLPPLLPSAGSVSLGGGGVSASPLPGVSISVPLPGATVGSSSTGVKTSGGISASLPGVGGASVGSGGVKVSPSSSASISLPVPDPVGSVVGTVSGVAGGLGGKLTTPTLP